MNGLRPALRAAGAGFLVGVRAPWRSKFVAATLALLAVVLAVLPAQLRGDGTPEGTLRMVLAWTLGTAVALLGVASLWAGCSAFSAEYAEKRHVGAAVSPAPAFALWLGRWLGLVAIDAALLAVVLAGAWVQVRARDLDAGRTRVRRLLSEDPVAFEREVGRVVAAAFPDGTDVPGRTSAENAAHAERVRDEIRRDMEGTTFLPVAPGGTREWTFVLPEEPLSDAACAFSFVVPYGAGTGPKGSVEAFDPATGAVLFREPVDFDSNGEIDFDLPATDFAGRRTFGMRFRNDDGEAQSAVLLCHRTAMRVFVPGGGLPANLLRAGVALLALLSLLSALGLACGCCFSVPVAAFAATALCAMVAVSGGEVFSGETPERGAHDHGHATHFSDRVLPYARAVARTLSATTAPVDDAEAVDRLGDGLRVEAPRVLRAFLLDGILLPLAFGAVGAAVLRRRWSETA